MNVAGPPILVHVGCPRCASTWIQQTLLPANSDRADRLIYATTTEAVISADPLSFDPREARDLLLADWTRDRPLVISNENLVGLLERGCYNAAGTTDRLSQALPEAHIWMVVREQVAELASFYRYLVQGQYRSSTPESVFGGIPHPQGPPPFDFRCLEYDRMVARYSELFGSERVQVSLYEELLSDGSRILADLAHATGVGLSTPEGAERLQALTGKQLGARGYRVSRRGTARRPAANRDGVLQRRSAVRWIVGVE